MDESPLARARDVAASDVWQMSEEEYRLIVETVAARSPCNFLVFGVGNDSDLWLAANRGGETLFVEDSPAWIDRVQRRGLRPPPRIVACRYAARPLQWLALARRSWLLGGMPAGMDDMPWHVILVDAPRGYRPWHPGRLQSVAWAAHLARCGQGGPSAGHPADVFVHDYDRRTERYAADRFLGRSHLVARIGRLAHFRLSVSVDDVVHAPLPRRASLKSPHGLSPGA